MTSDSNQLLQEPLKFNADGNVAVPTGTEPRKGANGFKDPAFASNKTLPLHRWVPWIAGFSSAFVRDAIEQHLTSKGVVLDPFCGVGTTLVEGLNLGHDVIGFEINPYAALASEVKANFRSIDITQLQELTFRFSDFYAKNVATLYELRSVPPPGFKTRAPF